MNERMSVNERGGGGWQREMWYMPPPGFLKSNNNTEQWASWWTGGRRREGSRGGSFKGSTQRRPGRGSRETHTEKYMKIVVIRSSLLPLTVRCLFLFIFVLCQTSGSYQSYIISTRTTLLFSKHSLVTDKYTSIQTSSHFAHFTVLSV